MCRFHCRRLMFCLYSLRYTYVFKIHVRTYFIQGILSGLIRFICNNLKRFFNNTATIILQVYNFIQFWCGEFHRWVNTQTMYLTNQFPNVFVQGLNLAKNRPTSLIWADYTCCISLLRYSVLFTVESLSLLYLLFIS